MPDLSDVLGAGPAQAVDDGPVIWHLGPLPIRSSGGDRADRERFCEEVLGAILDIGLPVYLRPPDNPPDPELASHLRQHSSGAWEVVSGRAGLQAMLSELGGGDWFLYAAPHPIEGDNPDTFRNSPTAVIEFMRRQQVACFVDSFHDDAEWMIGLLPATT